MCALMRVRIRHDGGGLTKAAYLSAHNGGVANVAIIVAGLLTYATFSAWPDLIVGIGIAPMNFDSARDVHEAAQRESDKEIRARR